MKLKPLLNFNKPINKKDSSTNNLHVKKRLNNFKRILGKNTDQFCKNTSLHGLKYLTDKELYPRERLFFGLAFATVVGFSGFFILEVWNKWSRTPVIFGTNPKPTIITAEPFPAVTICNLNVAYKSEAQQFSVFSTEYAMLQMLCKRKVNVTVAGTISDWSLLDEFMTLIAQPCSNMFISCAFGAVKYNCSELFKPIITDEGLCCTFNKVHPAFIYNNFESYEVEDYASNGGFQAVPWSSQNGYPKELPKKFYPRPAVGIGETLGLSITLDAEVDEYYCSSLNSIGFKLFVHSPMESPGIREVGLLLAPGRETKIRLRNDKYEADETLRLVNPKIRQCLFQDEKKLHIFSHYTQHNCETECFSKLLLKHCGCISYFMPKIYGNETICSIYESTCVERLRIASMLFDYNEGSCEHYCLASCFDINYSPDFFAAPLGHTGFQIANQAVKNMSSSYVEKNIAIVHMYYREYSYRSYKQTLLISGTDVLSSIGGLIGLFFGFSFISMVEIIFYAMMRPFRAAAARQLATEEVPNPLFKTENRKFKNLPAWKKPLRKRFKPGLNFNNNISNGSSVSYGNVFAEQIHMSTVAQKQKLVNDILKKWYNRQQYLV